MYGPQLCTHWATARTDGFFRRLSIYDYGHTLGGSGDSRDLKPGTNWLNFGDDPDHDPDPGVRSSKCCYTGSSNENVTTARFSRSFSFHRIPMNITRYQR